MKLKLLITAFCFSTLFSFAQINTQSYISLNLGPSIPFGNYAKAELYNENAGFARYGPNISVEGTYFFMDYIGLGGQFGFNMHFFNKRALREELNKENEIDYIDYSFVTPYFNLYGTMGLYFNIPVTEKFHITPKILAGFLTTITPELNAQVHYSDNSTSEISSDTELATTIAPLLGINFRYIVTNHFMLKFNVEGTSVRQQFEDFYGYVTGYESRISFLNANFSAGIAF